MLDVLEMKAARLKLTQPRRPPAAIEGKFDSCKQMLPPTGRVGSCKLESAILRRQAHWAFSSTLFPVRLERTVSVLICIFKFCFRMQSETLYSEGKKFFFIVNFKFYLTLPFPTLATPRAAARQAFPSMGFSRQEWSGLPFPSPGDFPDPGIEPVSPAS